MVLEKEIERLYETGPSALERPKALKTFNEFIFFLDRGEIRAAENTDGQWHVNSWVKMGILLGFRLGAIEDMSINQRFRFFDKDTFPPKKLTPEDGVRLVPGGAQ